MIIKPGKRLYRISFVSAFIFSLPVLIFTFWVIIDAYLDFKRYMNNEIKQNSAMPVPFSKEILHLYTNNTLKKLWIKFVAPDMPTTDNLPIFQIALSPRHLSELNSNLPESGSIKYQKSFIKYKNNSASAQLKYTGTSNWHWLYAKKSFTIKASQKKLIDGLRTVELKVPRWIWLFNEPIGSELSRELKIITPKINPVKLILNNTYMGLYFFQDPGNKISLRYYNLPVGNIYNGDLPLPINESQISHLWKNSSLWKKDAFNPNTVKEDYQDLSELLNAIQNENLIHFYHFCFQHLNLNAFYNFYCLDTVLACNSHNFSQNHKLYFDPWRAKFSPIYSDMGEMELGSQKIDLVGNPLLNRLKLIPQFEWQRQLTLKQLLHNTLSADRIISKIENYRILLTPAIAADVYRKYVNRQRSLVLGFPQNSPSEPFTMNQFETMVNTFKEFIVQRTNFLENYLKQTQVTCFFKNDQPVSSLILTAKGNTAALIKETRLTSEAAEIKIYQDSNLNRVFDHQDREIACFKGTSKNKVIKLNQMIFPGYKKSQMQTKSLFKQGDYQLEPSPLDFVFFVHSNHPIDHIAVLAVNAVTKQTIDVTETNHEDMETANTISLHPWQLPVPEKKPPLILGPGIISLADNHLIANHQPITIMPGTTVLVGPMISLVFPGKVTAIGTKDQPIIFAPQKPDQPWGGIMLEGNECSHSNFEYCQFQRGSMIQLPLREFSSVITCLDTQHISFSHCSFLDNHQSKNQLHYIYSSGKVSASQFTNSAANALQSDFSTVDIQYCYFNTIGHRAIHSFSSIHSIENTVFLNCLNTAVYADEKSQLAVNNNYFENCQIGIAIANQSTANYQNNFIKKSSIAIHCFRDNWYINHGGILNATVIYAEKIKSLLKVDKYSQAIYLKTVSHPPSSDFIEKTISAAGVFHE
jgi:hypothetical protein